MVETWAVVRLQDMFDHMKRGRGWENFIREGLYIDGWLGGISVSIDAGAPAIVVLSRYPPTITTKSILPLW